MFTHTSNKGNHRKRAGGVMLMAGSKDMAPKTDAERAGFTQMFNVQRAIVPTIAGLKVLIARDKAAAKP